MVLVEGALAAAFPYSYNKFYQIKRSFGLYYTLGDQAETPQHPLLYKPDPH